MRRKIVLTIAIFILFLSGCSQIKYDHVLIGENKIKVISISDTPETAYLGLSFKESICSNCSMLFPFKEKEIHTFVMRDMMFPLDIIWINDDEVVNIHKNLQPEGHETINSYSSLFPVNRVLEVNAGLTDKLNIKKGDKVKYNLGDYEIY